MKDTNEGFTSASGIPIKAVYTAEDSAHIDPARDIGLPGEAPYTRGIYPEMYRRRLWTIRRYSGFGTPEETNELYRKEYELGQTGFSIALDVPTGNGVDSDHPMAVADVGACGVPIDTIHDMRTMFEGLPIEKASTAVIAIPLPAPALTAMYFAVAEERGIDLKQLSGTTLNDITTALGCVGHMYQTPPRSQMRLLVDMVEWCCQNTPRWHPIAVDSYNYREQEITAVQEMGLLLATAIGIIEEGKKRGRVPLDDFVRIFSFDMGCHNDFFEEIAKFRATRRMWHKITRERFGTTDPRCWQFRFHAQTSGCTHTTQEPYNNLIRIAFQTLACAMGGAQSLHANSFEEGLCLPTDLGMLLSVRTEQIIQQETNVVNTVDPLGGSHYIEWLTSELEQRAWEYIRKIEDLGGIVSVLESGWIHAEFRKAFLEHAKKMESGEIDVVGVNRFKLDEEPYRIPVFRANPEASDIQIAKIKKVKNERDSAKVAETLDRLRADTIGGENIMPAVMEAVKAEATLGEICDVWRDIYGIWDYPMGA